MSTASRTYFLHPDLGIGGAERLVVDAALSLQQRGHRVVIYTSHHDPSHAFHETKDGTLEVRVRGDFLPTNIKGKGHILFATLRNFWAALCLIVEAFWHNSPPHLLFVDQISYSIPLFKLFGFKVLFYGHFPDMLLTQRRTFLKKLYRFPFDLAEQLTTGLSDEIVVNSRFTLSIFEKTFPAMCSIIRPTVLYPSINFSQYDQHPTLTSASQPLTQLRQYTFVSINRYERKKNIELAIRAFALLKQLLPQLFPKAQLVIAGGYDNRVKENVEHHQELQACARQLNLSVADFPSVDADVVFVRSFSEEQRYVLLENALAIVYTPSNEHFGIVPVEAMYARKPVIAVNNGGPLESIKDQVTGFLCPATPQEFANAMQILLSQPTRAKEMGNAGRTHVISHFSLQTFGDNLDRISRKIIARRGVTWQTPFMMACSVVVAILVIFVSNMFVSTRVKL